MALRSKRLTNPVITKDDMSLVIAKLMIIAEKTFDPWAATQAREALDIVTQEVD